jgi:NarL family two-component system response regulator LiaR
MKILIVDDHEAVLNGVACLVESEAPRWQLAGLARSGTEALRLAQALRPDVVVLDLCLAGESGLDLLPELARTCGGGIVILTSLADAQMRARALRVGAHGYVSKLAPAAELVAAIDAAYCARSVSAEQDKCHVAPVTRIPPDQGNPPIPRHIEARQSAAIDEVRTKTNGVS